MREQLLVQGYIYSTETPSVCSEKDSVRGEHIQHNGQRQRKSALTECTKFSTMDSHYEQSFLCVFLKECNKLSLV